jgi:hypothetical protein
MGKVCPRRWGQGEKSANFGPCLVRRDARRVKDMDKCGEWQGKAEKKTEKKT